MARRSFLVLACFAALLTAVGGCAKEEYVGIPHEHHPDAEVTFCGYCGHLKGSENCCKEGAEGAELCPNCGLHKGSFLCCSPVLSGRRDVVLCRKCGEVAFGEKCCKPGPALCAKCGLHRGSPGCCKIEKYTGESVGH
jgi:hypothetical protein